MKSARMARLFGQVKGKVGAHKKYLSNYFVYIIVDVRGNAKLDDGRCERQFDA
jgi:hypothetical protein